MKNSYLKIPHYRAGFLHGLQEDHVVQPEAETKNNFSLPVNIQLARHTLSCENFPPWFAGFKDTEDIFALHRWGWLLMLAVEQPSYGLKKWGIEVIRDWFLKMVPRDDHPARESYSASERIINCILFLYCLRDFAYEETDKLYGLEKNLIEEGGFLKDNLEYKGRLTNNHILNNARALYMLGRFASCEELADIGRQIFIAETPKMITSSGFLREGSSNYHLLLLRTYLEVLWTAERTEDKAFVTAIKPVAKQMVRVAWFFSVYDEGEREWGMPLFGDVSPDFPPEWFDNVAKSALALRLYKPFECETDFSKGWNKIWKDEKREYADIPG